MKVRSAIVSILFTSINFVLGMLYGMTIRSTIGFSRVRLLYFAAFPLLLAIIMFLLIVDASKKYKKDTNQ
jgi:hypothetical protein